MCSTQIRTLRYNRAQDAAFALQGSHSKQVWKQAITDACRLRATVGHGSLVGRFGGAG